MRTQQPNPLLARPAYGVPEGVVANEHASVASSVLPLPLLILVIGLAVATVWFIALPAFDKPPAERSCEVVVLKSGAPACVPEKSLRHRHAARR